MSRSRQQIEAEETKLMNMELKDVLKKDSNAGLTGL